MGESVGGIVDVFSWCGLVRLLVHTNERVDGWVGGWWWMQMCSGMGGWASV